jgi:hypothetical protein
MRAISSQKRLILPLLRSGATHIFATGFEERCLAYPRWLHENCPNIGKHRFLCVECRDRMVSDYLLDRQQRHRRELQELFASTQFVQADQLRSTLDSAISQPAAPVFIDISSLPRRYIFRLADLTISLARNNRRVFLVYTYPMHYHAGPLQRPSGEFDSLPSAQDPCFDAPRLLLIPGFDLEYANLIVSYARARWADDFSVTWLFPFVRRYEFYERALEAHLHLLHPESYRLISQDVIGLSVRQLVSCIQEDLRPIVVCPLGPRIVGASVSLALRLVGARQPERPMVIVVPRTARYDSLRSAGAEEPLLEEIGIYLARA